jgi:hypothetical protein
MRGDLDSGTVPSQQSHMSAMRTDDRDLHDGVFELRTQDGYFADSSSDEALSENSFSSPGGW